MKIIWIMLTVLVIMAVTLAGCAVSQPAGSALEPEPALITGRLEIKVTDAPAKEEISGILVKIKGIEVHKAGAAEDNQTSGGSPADDNQTDSDNVTDNLTWIPVEVDTGREFDLLKVKDHPESLGITTLEVGDYTQIRLEVDTVKIIFGSGSETHTEEAVVPGGKIKFIQPFKITSGDTTQLLFDFDAARSVHVTENGKVMFKPVIKLTSNQKSEGKPVKSGRNKGEKPVDNQTKTSD